jgi:hypothetical protein
MRESKSCKDSLEKLKRLHEDERKAVQNSVKEISDQIITLSVAKEQEYSKRIDVQDQNKDLRVTIDKLRSQVRKNI